MQQHLVLPPKQYRAKKRQIEEGDTYVTSNSVSCMVPCSERQLAVFRQVAIASPLYTVITLQCEGKTRGTNYYRQAELDAIWDEAKKHPKWPADHARW